MARPASRHPTELELDILKILWRRGPLSVRRVWTELAGKRDLAQASVTTIMNIMVEKGYLRRQKQAGVYVYAPQISESEMSGRMLSDVVERVFDGSASAVMLKLLESAELDEGEVRRIRAMLKRHNEGGKS